MMETQSKPKILKTREQIMPEFERSYDGLSGVMDTMQNAGFRLLPDFDYEARDFGTFVYEASEFDVTADSDLEGETVVKMVVMFDRYYRRAEIAEETWFMDCAEPTPPTANQRVYELVSAARDNLDAAIKGFWGSKYQSVVGLEQALALVNEFLYEADKPGEAE